MLSKLNDKKIKLLYQVNREWNERIFRYEIKEYQKDCQEFIRIFCEIEKIEIPVIVFFDSPLASLFAVEFIKSIYWSGEYSGDWIDDEMIQEVWMKVSEHPLVELNNTSETMRTAISKSVLNALNNCVWDINYKEKDCSNCLIDGKYWVSQNTIFKPDIDYCIYKRNMEHIKTKISYHIWEVITPTWDKDDYMLNSFNYGVGANILTGLENRIASVDDSMVPISFKTYNWFPIYDFMSRAGIMKDELFNSLRKIMLNGVYDFYWYNQFCFITTLPTKICRNEKGNFHSLDGAAVKFIDGYSNYNLDGREFPAWIWEMAANNKITKELFLKEKNVEIKSAIYEVLGQEKMLNLIGAMEVDRQSIVHKNGDIEEVVLLKSKRKFKEIENQPFAWVKMICPSTNRTYLEGVAPHYIDAVDALASLSPFNKTDYSFNYRT